MNLVKTAGKSMPDGAERFRDTGIETYEALLSAREFQEKIITEILGRHTELRVSIKNDVEFDAFIQGLDEVFSTANVSNAYGKYRENPSDLERHIFAFTDMMSEGIAEYKGVSSEISHEQLAVVLRHTDYLESLHPSENIWRPFYGDMIATLVFYHPDFVVNVRAKDLEALSINKGTAWDMAAENLKDRYNDLEVWNSNMGSNFMGADSGLATGHLWLLVRDGSDVNYNAIVINKHNYLFAPMHNSEATNILASYAAHLIKKGDTLSENLISSLDGYLYASYLNGETWLPIQPNNDPLKPQATPPS